MFCLSGLFMVNTSQADSWEIIINGDFCDNRDDGVYGNLSDCRWFYQCVNHLTYARKCEVGLVFDWNLRACNYAWATDNPANCPY